VCGNIADNAVVFGTAACAWLFILTQRHVTLRQCILSNNLLW